MFITRPFNLRFATDEQEGGDPEDQAKIEPEAEQPAEEPQEESKPDEESVDYWRAKAKKNGNEAKNLRSRIDTEKQAAAEAARKELIQKFGKELGLIDAEPDPSELTKALEAKSTELTQAQAEAQALRAENTLIRVASKKDINADVTALTDSREFSKKLAAIDAASADYASQVEQLVRDEVSANARFRRTQVAPSSGGNKTTTGDSKSQLSREDLKKLSPKEILQAQKDGRLHDLLKH